MSVEIVGFVLMGCVCVCKWASTGSLPDLLEGKDADMMVIDECAIS